MLDDFVNIGEGIRFDGTFYFKNLKSFIMVPFSYV